MKRAERDPAKFGVLELFAALARTNGFRLDRGEDLNEFAKMVLNSIQTTHTSGTILHGKRTEAMFAYIAAALGKCMMIKAEDAGDMFVKGPPMQAPDYRIVLDDRSTILVEVKNFHTTDFRKRFVLKLKYFDKIQSYAVLLGLPLKIAIYFSNFNKWCLLPTDAFEKTEKGLEISFVTAMAKNEMVLLGDVALATLPELRLELMGKAEEASSLNSDGEAAIIFRSGKIFCGGVELIDVLDQRIAFYLMRFGSWNQAAEAIVKDEKLLGVRFISHSNDFSEGQPFAIIGDMSSMIAQAYSEYTISGELPFAVDISADPSNLTLSIPNDFHSEQLPLWRFLIEPNTDFKELNN